MSTSLRSVGAYDLHVTLTIRLTHSNVPGITAHLAILNERSSHVRLDVDLDLLAAVRACNGELVVHGPHAMTDRIRWSRPTLTAVSETYASAFSEASDQARGPRTEKDIMRA
jgi:hypothetical protein